MVKDQILSELPKVYIVLRSMISRLKINSFNLTDSWWPHGHRLPEIREFGYQKEPLIVGLLDQASSIEIFLAFHIM